MARAQKRFRHVRNDGFVCEHCGTTVLPLANGSCRNHCPQCLWSKHVDDTPGDRQATCGGLMECVDVQQDCRRGWMLVHSCRRCGATRRNRAALNDPQQSDRWPALLATMKKAAQQPRRERQRRTNSGHS